MAKVHPTRSTHPPAASRNKLLAALPKADYARISPLLTTVPLTFKRILHKQGSRIDTVYFPNGGVCSVTNVMSDGRMVEVATIGNEGMVGITIFLGGEIAAGEAFVQVPDGEALAMSADNFRRELDRHGPFYDLMSRYSQAFQALIMQSTACNSLHTVEERASRWLLMTHDRAGSDEFQLTHEFLGYMLGVRRPTVSLVLGTLDKAGAISNGMKKIRIVNRERLEGTACECYDVVRRTFERLFPPPTRLENCGKLSANGQLFRPWRFSLEILSHDFCSLGSGPCQPPPGGTAC
ncbi:MAG TPA: Crp/Fnr family transcriptional regulator [Vicinamibacterales bacterium]|nr:Crp/Fnr family transcriptional regulator [Vicinamibacterales bacterium]